MQIKIKKMHPKAIAPEYATNGSACFDLRVVGLDKEEVLLMYGAPFTFRTGLAFEIPDGHVMLIFSRSGHGFKNSTRLANCVGVIDSDYRGEVEVRLTADGFTSLTVRDGDRIAQAMIVPIPRVEFVKVRKLSNTQRGAGGFGSTGN